MTKTKTPFMSLGSSGSVGGVLTAQRRGNATLIRQKPIPTNPQSLRQMYQRWLYQDYIAWWRTLTSAQKLVYNKLGSRCHQTGFAYWMGNRLSLLPDIALGYRLDNLIGASTPDFSPNARHATVYGANLSAGVIDNGLVFDGIDNYIRPPNFPISGDLTIHSFIRPGFSSTEAINHGIFRFRINGANLIAGFYTSTPDFRLYYKANNVLFGTVDGFTFTSDEVIHLCWTITPGDRIRSYINGVYQSQSALLTETISTADAIPYIGRDPSYSGWWLGLIDHFIVLNRVLDPTEIPQLAERRYPL